MSETPKFEVIDRRKMKAEEEQESQHAGNVRRKPRLSRRVRPPSPARDRGWW